MSDWFGGFDRVRRQVGDALPSGDPSGRQCKRRLVRTQSMLLGAQPEVRLIGAAQVKDL